MRQQGRLMTVVAMFLTLAAGCKEAAPRPPMPDPVATRNTTFGAVIGFAGADGVQEWRGIPFAAPPVGPLRWRVAEPPRGWTGTRPALAFGSPCVQYASPFGGVEGKDGEVRGSEDCLFLNVYAPRRTPKEVAAARPGVPVMVWIHGGGNTIGHAGFYDPAALVTAQQLVVVTVNYRLGPFGWFRHPALRVRERVSSTPPATSAPSISSAHWNGCATTSRSSAAIRPG
jgi:para-nitrobenzyl esterase